MEEDIEALDARGKDGVPILTKGKNRRCINSKDEYVLIDIYC